MIVNLIKHTVAYYFPEALFRKLTANRYKAIDDLVATLDIRGHQKISLGQLDLRAITLANGPELIAHLPTRTERRLIGAAAVAHGLDASYAKVLIDAITRYEFPHMATAFQTLPYTSEQRGLFHPQHRNLVAEDAILTADQKAKIARVFTPKAGWFVLDIGAYLGHGSLWLQSRIESTGAIICVEASPENYSVLCEELSRNDVKNVTPKNAAIWKYAGESVEFNTSSRQANAIDSEVVDGTSTCSIQTTSIAELTGELGRAADLVSLTVNGAEVEALEGLFQLSTGELPKRIMAPGWYRKNGKVRAEIIMPLLRKLDYEVVKTAGHMIIAWRKDLT